MLTQGDAGLLAGCKNNHGTINDRQKEAISKVSSGHSVLTHGDRKNTFKFKLQHTNVNWRCGSLYGGAVFMQPILSTSPKCSYMLNRSSCGSVFRTWRQLPRGFDLLVVTQFGHHKPKGLCIAILWKHLSSSEVIMVHNVRAFALTIKKYLVQLVYLTTVHCPNL